MNKFDDIPDDLLQKILSRLVCKIEHVFQCKCVCKRWLHVISNPDFIGQCINVQRDDFPQTPATLATLVLFNRFNGANNDLFLSSQNPFLISRKRNFILDFLPCYKDVKRHKKLAQASSWPIPREPGDLIPPVVIGSYKDLVLCCATKDNQRDYFISNPITKHWVALPPTPRVYKRVEMAFTCDPYYNDVHGVAAPAAAVINPHYIWKVVRLVPKNPKLERGKFNVEIFSSKTRAWRKMVVFDSQLTLHSMIAGYIAALAYKGKLYWYCDEGIIFELDLDDHNYKKMKNKNKNINTKVNIAKCRLIKLPKSVDLGGIPHLVLSGGCMRLYMYILSHKNQGHSLKAWELNEVVKDDKVGEFKWLVNKVPLSVKDENMSFYRPREDKNSFHVVTFHQQNSNVMYFKWSPYLATCHISESGRLEIVTQIEYRGPCFIWYHCYRFLFPGWPTPVHL